jgi:hypothetical protein
LLICGAFGAIGGLRVQAVAVAVAVEAAVAIAVGFRATCRATRDSLDATAVAPCDISLFITPPHNDNARP